MDLRDLRAKISVETDAALDAAQHATGKDRSEIVREVLHAWALGEIAEAMADQWGSTDRQVAA